MLIKLQDFKNNIENYILNLEISPKLKKHSSLGNAILEIKNILNTIEEGKIILRMIDVNSFYIQIIYQDCNYDIDKIINEIKISISIDSSYENPCLYFDIYKSKLHCKKNPHYTYTLDSNHESKVYNKNNVLIEREYKELSPCTYNLGYIDSTKLSYEQLLTKIFRTSLSTRIEKSENDYNKVILLHRNKFDVAEYYCKNNNSEYGAVIPVSIEHGIANINIKDESYFKEYVIPSKVNTSVKLQKRIMYR